ncbi:3-hydroxyacyl-CoA dehydrogenase family protein [Paenibacillus sp. HN-1]|uniref:3-hydroxyacyl-CoA dehydrogenase family protein n=1 Tax=Paenibacillus TaxID=44249 RepID=UPI001CAA1B04|nr:MULTISPECIES: 3-hydroxyacyl-CoA dehydrogenase family protein [Paenibacillus]MBY9077390.1 3-hydroxyacyl-CoA dehydrogenase family protein [Paenibacillus sp. CGMCC 1.18879]MBY9087502.1 3-hydroxyacyl-CoA dehydrogenase family protein [Paenibacillus sinensis]
MELKVIGVIGAGTMGIGLAVDLLVHGFKVVLTDISDKQLETARSEITKGIRFVPLLNKELPAFDAEEALRQIVFTLDINDVKDCDFIVENVPEEFEIKEQVYTKLDAICKKSACFGVNTSCISITRIGALTTRPDKVLGMHFMNPVVMKSTIEVIRGEHTSEGTIDTAKVFLAGLQKEAVVVNDLPGFVSNRISHLFMNEAAFVVQDQLAEPKQVDKIFKECFGHKMGPLETADLIGLDTVVKSLDVLFESFQDPKYRCCPMLRKMVHAGRMGRKSGQGFYSYTTINN